MDSPVVHLVDRLLEREKDTTAKRDKITANCQGSREAVRKRTFTRWINTHLKKFDPSLQVDDLYTDVQDGKILMVLLEELSGCKMLYRFRPSTHRIFTLSNIAKVLEFLEDRNVRVTSMDAADIADGKPSVILALIWTIIVYFQLKEVTGSLKRRFSSSVSSLVSLADSSDSSRSSPVPSSDEHCSTLPSKRKRESRQPKYYRSRAISTLLNWTQTCTTPYGVEVQDFGKSWRNGLAFLALVKCARPELVNMTAALTLTPRENLTQAFRAAQHCLGIPPLLDPEDVMMCSPDEQSVITYVSQFLQHFPQIRDEDTLMFPEDTFSPIIDYSDLELSSQKKLQETYGGLSNGSEESIHILPELDSEEEDAYRYILELDHEEFRSDNELKKCSAASNAHDLGDLHHTNGEGHHIYLSLGIQKQSLQLSSEASRETHEEHRPEGDLFLNTNKIDGHHRHDELAMVTPAGPDLCTLNDQKEDTLMFPEDTFSPIIDYSDLELSSPSLGFERDLEAFTDFSQKEPNQEPAFSLEQCNTSSSYHCLSSTVVFKAGLPTAEEDEFIQSNGQYLHSSIEGHCWHSLSQKKLQETYGGLSHGSEESIHILPELDSEEEDAYSYILELDHEEFRSYNELKKCSAASNAHDLGDLHHTNGEGHHIYLSLGIQKQSLQLSSEASRETHEEHRPEGDLFLNTNKIDGHHRHDELAMVTPAGPDLCTLNDHLNITHIHIKDLHNYVTAEPSVSESDRTLISSNSPSRDESLHTRISSDMDNQSLSVVSLTESALIQEDELNEVKEPMKNSLSDDYLQSRDFTPQTNLSSTAEEPRETSSTSEAAKDLSVTVLGDAMNSDLLHTVLLLWILTYCIFMLPQIETWMLF